jgi:hypothetical protein
VNRSSLCSAITIAVLLGALGIGNPFLAADHPAHVAPRTSVRPVGGSPVGANPVGVNAAGVNAVALRAHAAVHRVVPVVAAVPAFDNCPRETPASRVVRAGYDVDGHATWWHEDGSRTKVVAETGGEHVVVLPADGDEVR